LANIVRTRCIRFISLLHELGFDELPLNDAIFLFQKHMSIMDKKSLNAYFGQHELRQRSFLDKTTRYQNGTVSMSKIEMYRRLIQKQGYFEILDLAEIKKEHKQLVFCANHKGLVNEIKIIFSPPLPHSSSENVIDEFSYQKHGADLYLSPYRHSSVGELESLGFKSSSNNVINNSNNNNLRGEREKSDYPVIEKNDSRKMNVKEKETEISALNSDNSVIIAQEEIFSTHLSDEPVKLRKQPSEADILSLYEKSCKDKGVEPDLLFSQTLSLEQRDRREAKKRD